MLSDTEKAVLGDIRYFIDLIGSFLEGYDYRVSLATCALSTRSRVASRSYPRRQGECRRTLRHGIPRSSGGRRPPPATNITTTMKMRRNRSFRRPVTALRLRCPPLSVSNWHLSSDRPLTCTVLLRIRPTPKASMR